MIPVNRRDLLAGVVVALVGGAFFLAARSLPAGPSGQIGPGFVPSAVGLMTVGLGLAIAARAFGRSVALPRVALRPVLAIFASVAVFGLLIRTTGLAPALVGTTIVSTLGSPKNRPVPTVALALSVAIGCTLIFIVALGLPFDAVRSPF